MDEELEYIIILLGEKNQEIDDDLMEGLIEEIATLEHDLIYDLTLDVISLGKWQMLESILNNNNFTKVQINDFKNALEDYVNNDDDDDDDIRHSFGQKMEDIIMDTIDNPVNWMKSVKIS